MACVTGSSADHWASPGRRCRSGRTTAGSECLHSPRWPRRIPPKMTIASCTNGSTGEMVRFNGRFGEAVDANARASGVSQPEHRRAGICPADRPRVWAGAPRVVQAGAECRRRSRSRGWDSPPRSVCGCPRSGAERARGTRKVSVRACGACNRTRAHGFLLTTQYVVGKWQRNVVKQRT